MKTFRFTIPEPRLTKHEAEGKKKKESLTHSDYIRAFIGFWILAWIVSFVLGNILTFIPVENPLVLIAFFVAVLVLSYLSFFWATKYFLVSRLKVDQGGGINSEAAPLRDTP
ncbi:hypothetical protein SH580_21820 [Coraliomargarita algicola]|uniref:Uncharacterized protein n=1 Tax=Coraliomargarita algicola TaxID=3092156 RepID=A0ABZ0RR46_9BACT|nr:hypothetical protein [Coraliomargarita sp. J2-16]WPJ95404.1 hypothetical protein SH580_18450 [Coraliomargarita sp. J2-16]WPJ96057.1 hypothetical protein SH580_21820 [Coraliomargarita sp. J2-16]